MKKIGLLIIGMSFFFMGTRDVQAEGIGFSVQAELPSNQIDKNLSYFDLKMESGAQQDISVMVKNSTDKEEVVNLEINNALTNSNGLIDYSKHGVKPDISMEYPIEQLIKNNKQQIKLSAGESKKVSFHISMPKERIVGSILGGIKISEPEKDKKNRNDNVTIKNLFSYVIGIHLRESLDVVPVKMNLKRITPSLMNYRTVVNANLQNGTPTILKDVSVDAKVKRRGSEKILHETKKEDMSIAPNTNFNFPVSWDNQRFNPGTYEMDVRVESNQGKWDFEKEFVIKGNQVRKINNEAVEIEKEDYTIIYILIGVIILLGILFIGYFLKNKTKEEKDEKIN